MTREINPNGYLTALALKMLKKEVNDKTCIVFEEITMYRDP